MAKRSKHEEWFLRLPQERFVDLNQRWVAKFLHSRNCKLQTYDDWFNFFRKVSPDEIRRLNSSAEGTNLLTAEAYAALRRWVDIFAQPQRMEKICQTGLTAPAEEKKSITELARENDVLGTLCAIRDDIAAKLDRGTGARDTAALTRQMTDVMAQIKAEERRRGPGEDTVLANLLGVKRTRGQGARNTSFRSKTSIKELEANE